MRSTHRADARGVHFFEARDDFRELRGIEKNLAEGELARIIGQAARDVAAQSTATRWREIEHKVQMAKKQSTMSAPATKRIVCTESTGEGRDKSLAFVFVRRHRLS